MRQIQCAAIVMAGASLLLLQTGCASKKYVRGQTAPLAQKTNELDDQTAQNNRSVKELDQRTTTGIQGVQTAANTADQHATAAGQSATQAEQAAQNAFTRADSLAGVVANLDSYKTVSDVAVNFATGKANLRKAEQAKLDEFGSKVNGIKSYILQVTGGTDSTGGAQLNYDLSQRRAETVVQYLASKYNVPPRKFYLIGIGKDQEVASNKTAKGRAENRRVQVQLLTNMDQNGQPQQSQSTGTNKTNPQSNVSENAPTTQNSTTTPQNNPPQQ